MANPAARYRFLIEGPVSREVFDAFPALSETRRPDGRTELVGRVVDPCQLAGIVSSICHRNGALLHLEQLEGSGGR